MTVCNLSQSERETLSYSEQIYQKNPIILKKKSIKWKTPSNCNLGNLNLEKKRDGLTYMYV